MSDLLETLKRDLSERLSSPLISSFCISWALWNYKFLLIVASSNSISTTFALIEKFSFSSIGEIATKGLLLPTLTALAYIYLYPIPAEYIYKRVQQNNKRLKEIRSAIEDQTPLTVEESRKVRLQLFQANEQHARELESKVADIEALKEALRAANEQLTTAKPPPYTKYRSLPPLQRRILNTIADCEDGEISRRLLLDEVSGNTIEIEFSLGELREDSLISDVTNENMEVVGYKITHKGRGNLLFNLKRNV